MNKKNLNQFLLLLSCLLTQNNVLNAMKRSFDQISSSAITKYSPQQKPVTNTVALGNISTKAKLYSCLPCDKSPFQKNDFIVHVIENHTGNFACSMCNKSFSQKAHLAMHMRCHTGEKPYTCSLCDKSFIQKSYLMAHERTHTGEKSYTYEICNESFSREKNLIMHMRTHTMGGDEHPVAIKPDNMSNVMACINPDNMSDVMACINPVVNPEGKKRIKVMLMSYQNPESVFSMLPKDILKLIIIYMYPEYAKGFGANPELLAGLKPQILVDRLPLEHLTDLITKRVLGRDVVVEAWKQKVDRIIQESGAYKANLRETLISKFKMDLFAYINKRLT